ncbi:hypothetical protein [Thiocystis violacea]|uniref:hypothetical protein n=1 Tax=Thiocystis violacea TaxID=13725 RepID=UPI001904D4BC|nr:hypothetical protein [Thiocystis violacea]MBK1725309.1 hypothetical protein [Thiocystis violacea]
MDPISALLAGYLNAATQAFDHMDLALRTEAIEHQGLTVTFTHQQWRIREASVCEGERGDVVRLARCTAAAKDLFRQVCQALQANPRNHPDDPSLQRMYCSAAARYRPTQASVEWAEPVEAEAQARQACRLAQAALLTENTPETRHRRKVACEGVKRD